MRRVIREELSPYGKFIGSFAQRMPLEVREAQLLRPLQKQIYKDKENVLYLKKDDKPLRETAIMVFDGSGWLKRITFTWEENYDIDLDKLCVAGVCLGDTTEKLIERLGPPDNYNMRRGRMVGDWNREGLRVYARQKGKKIFMEVKNCSLAENRVAMFPDAVTARGTKHLQELAALKQQGCRAAVLFCVQRGDAECFMPAAHIDPLYAENLAKAAAEGVMVLAYQAEA